MAHLDILDTNGKTSGTLLLAEDVKPPELLFLTVGAESVPRLENKPAGGFLFALAHTARAWVALAKPGGPVVEVNGFVVVGLKVLDQGDEVSVAKLRLRFSNLVIEELSANSRLVTQGKACPICQEPFQPSEHAIYCPTCKLAHHADSQSHPEHCLYFSGRCGSRPWCGYVVPTELHRS